MTVAAGAAKAGPFTGNNVTSSFAFTFKVFADADIRVVKTVIATGVESDFILNTDYTVVRNADQDNNPGGTITYKVGGVTTALPSTLKLTIVGDFDYEQPADIPNGGAFFASVVENAFDRITMLIKQLKENVDRAVTVDVSSATAPADLLDEITDAVAAAQAISTLYDTFDDRFLGAKASDPTQDNDGDALLVGALYFNTTTGVMRVYNIALAWQDAVGSATISGTTQTFDGDGVDTTFTLSAAPPAVQLLEVFISGVRQVPLVDYTLGGTTLAFTVAPPVGTDNIFCYWVSQVAASVPGDGSVSTAKFAADAMAPLARVPSSSTATTLVAADASKCVKLTAGITVPASVFAADDVVSLYNNSGSSVTITQGGGLTLRQVGTANTGHRTLAQRGMATLWFVSPTEAVIAGGGLT